MTTMYDYDTEVRDAKSAIDAFVIDKNVGDSQHRYVKAHSDTGSNYEVYANVSPAHPEEYVVTVMWPYQTAWTTGPWEVTYTYAREHWGNPFRDGRGIPTHGGDLASVCIAINLALGFDLTTAKANADPS